MVHVLIATYGSRGDTMPLAGVGLRLQQAGHAVTITTNHELDRETTELGLDARGVPLDLGEPDGEPSLADAMKLIRPAGIRQLSRNVLEAVDDVPADVVLTTPFTEPAMHALAEARGIPIIGARLQPLSATREYPPSLLGAWSSGGTINRATGRFAEGTVDRMYAGVVAELRRDIGLPRRSARALRHDRSRAQWPILCGWSPAPDLEAFLADGPPPVLVGLGSLLVPAQERDRLAAIVDEALAVAGVRGLVQSGGAGLRVPDREGVLNIDTVPYEHILPRVAAIAHSGGDQPFWARRLHALGAGTLPIARTKVTVSALAEAIRAAVSDSRYRTAAGALSSAIATEDGAATVLRVVAGQ